MKKSRYSPEQVAFGLRQADEGTLGASRIASRFCSIAAPIRRWTRPWSNPLRVCMTSSAGEVSNQQMLRDRVLPARGCVFVLWQVRVHKSEVLSAFPHCVRAYPIVIC